MRNYVHGMGLLFLLFNVVGTSVSAREYDATDLFAHELLTKSSYRNLHDTVITDYEYAELKLKNSIYLFDRTQTAFGLWGLEQLTKPVANLETIKRRQDAIKQCVVVSEKYDDINSLLTRIKRNQHHLLAYYQENDQLNESAKELYYQFFGSKLNKSKLALDYAYCFEIFSSIKNVFFSLGGSGLFKEIVCAQSENRPFSLIEGFKKGVTSIFSSHSIDDLEYQRLKDKMVVTDIDSAWYYFLWEKLWPAGATNIFMNGTLGDRWSLGSQYYGLPSVVALMWAAAQIGWTDHALYSLVHGNYKRLIFIYGVHKQLQQRLVLVATCMKDIQKLIDIAYDIPALKEHKVIVEAYAALHSDASHRLHELFMQLDTVYANKKTPFYSRGQLLITHALLKQLKMLLLPIMQAIGIIDGFASICTTYQLHKDNVGNQFCFVHLIESERPFIEIERGWLPLLQERNVENSVALGAHCNAAHLLLSGPSGSGKSTFLKLLGNVVVFAQSWGIVPASACTLSVFDGVRTSFNPQEDIERNISTFMAQQERVSVLENYIKRSDPTKHYLLLLDEPYRGTIEAEAEKRVYNWCSRTALYHSCMMVVASHLRTPLALEKTDGAFMNKHLEVLDGDNGTFIRTFKLIDGAAWWWFNDIERRMRFVDWLHSCCPQDG